MTGPRLSRRRCRGRDAATVNVKHRPTNCGGVDRDRSVRLCCTYGKFHTLSSVTARPHSLGPLAIAGCLLASMENTTASGTHRAGSPIPISGPTLPSPTSAQHGSYRRISCRQRRWCTTLDDDHPSSWRSLGRLEAVGDKLSIRGGGHCMGLSSRASIGSDFPT